MCQNPKCCNPKPWARDQGKGVARSGVKLTKMTNKNYNP